jgi:hypothetical protein
LPGASAAAFSAFFGPDDSSSGNNLRAPDPQGTKVVRPQADRSPEAAGFRRSRMRPESPDPGQIAQKWYFWYAIAMELQINPRGNGACPICALEGRCTIQSALKDSLKEKNKGEELELVVYTCPRFKEKF